MRMAGTMLAARVVAIVLAFGAPAGLARGGNAASGEPDMQIASARSGIAALFGGNCNLSGFRHHVDAGVIIMSANTIKECIPGNLKGILRRIAEEFGNVSVRSTHRSPQRNHCISIAAPSILVSMRADTKSWPGCTPVPMSEGSGCTATASFILTTAHAEAGDRCHPASTGKRKRKTAP